MTKSVLVVGAGIVGASIAMRLARAGARVTVADLAPPGTAASARSFGWINANRAAPDYYRLRSAAIAAWDRLAGVIGPCTSSPGGGLYWQEGDWSAEAEAAALNACDAIAPYGAQVVARDRIAALEPALADPPPFAVLTPRERSADAADVARRLIAAAAGQGAVLASGARVLSLIPRAVRVAGAQTDFGPLLADHTVLAAGTATGDLLAPLDLPLPMENRPGLILHSRPAAARLSHVVMTPDVHVRQDPDGRLILGEVFFGEGPNAALIDTDPARLADLLAAALRRRLPDLAQPVAAMMLGLRPVPGDGLPAVGLAAPGLHVAVMHSGVTLGPLIGELVAAEVMEGAESPLLAPYRPGRFAAGSVGASI